MELLHETRLREVAEVCRGERWSDRKPGRAGVGVKNADGAEM